MKVIRWLLVPISAVAGAIWALAAYYVAVAAYYGVLYLVINNSYPWVGPTLRNMSFFVASAIAVFGFVLCGSLTAPSNHRFVAKWLLFAIGALGLPCFYVFDIMSRSPSSIKLITCIACAIGGGLAVLSCESKKIKYGFSGIYTLGALLIICAIGLDESATYNIKHIAYAIGGGLAVLFCESIIINKNGFGKNEE